MALPSLNELMGSVLDIEQALAEDPPTQPLAQRLARTTNGELRSQNAIRD